MVPDVAVAAAARVPVWVRSRLDIDVHAVVEDGPGELHGSTALTDPDDVGFVVVQDVGDQP